MIGRTLSNFRITAKIGEGGMGEVYRAQDTKLGRDVAIKVLPAALSADPDRLARFRREARVLASLNHQNIAAIHDVQEIDGRLLLILELVEGEGLDERIRRGALPLAEALDAARQIAEALETAHEKGIVHRDLKPANVKITPEGLVKVLDFGLAKAMEAEVDPASAAGPTHSPTLTANMTGAGVLLGTAAYMSPEQARGHPADKRADVWAFGCVLYEMLTGRQVFKENTVSDTLAAVLKSEPSLGALPGETPERIRRLVRRCLEKDPRQRLRDIGEARIAAAKALQAPEERAAETTGGRRGEAAPGARRFVPWLVACALAVTVAVLAYRVATFRPAPSRVVRTSLSLPDGVQLALAARHPGAAALSPDGNRIVFSVREAEGRVRLWVRDLDTLLPRPLAGTDGAGYPFWSPTGDYIGFFADGKLKKIESDGGAVLSLCDAPAGKGGSWSPEGVIVFAPDAGARIHKVPAAGGEPVAVTPDLGTQPDVDSNRHPRFLPDGRHFLYLARKRTEKVDRNAVELGSIDGEPSTILFENSTQAEYANGHLLFVREGVLMARPFDPVGLKFTGDAFPVAEDVGVIAGASLAVFSVSGDVLSYVPGEIGGGSVQLAWVDRSGKALETVGDPAAFLEVHLSPDERQATVSLAGADGTEDLWIWDLGRKVRTRFTFAEGSEFAAAWSPDGARVAYASARGGAFDAYVKSATGAGDEEPLLVSKLDPYPTDWSPDGKYVVFNTHDPETGDWGVLALDVASGETFSVNDTPEFFEGYPKVSPDGRWLTYVSDESGRQETYVTAFPAGGRKWQVSTSGGAQPQWSRDGRQIYSIVPATGMLTVTEVRGGTDTFTVGEARDLFEVANPNLGYKYAPGADGTRFLVLQPTDTAPPQPLTLVVGWTEEVER